MSGFYNPQRKSNLYNHQSTVPFRLSRNKIDLFINCPRCFYLDRKLGVAQPPGYPFSLNSAVEKLLKKEFDIHRVNGTKHPLCDQLRIGKLGISARWKYISGYLGKTDIRFQILVTLFTVMATQIKRLLMENWNLI
jgi:hypothetical protein